MAGWVGAEGSGALPDGGAAGLPTFLVIGAMKSGTSTLARALRAHADVFVHPRKELHFFDEDITFRHGPAWYGAQFSDRGDVRAWGEATPDYMRLAEVCAPRIAATVRHARLVALLRDPVDRAYSHYWHQHARGRETLPFEEALAAEARGQRVTDGRRDRDLRYLHASRYATQLDTFVAHSGRESLLIEVFEDFVSAPVPVLRRVLTHLGVDASNPPPLPDAPVNAYSVPRIPAVQRRLRGRTHRVLLALGLEGGPVRDVIARVRKATWRPGSYPPLPAATRAKLAELFAAEREALASRFGIDVSSWTQG